MAIVYKLQAQGPATTNYMTQAYISNKALTSNLATLTTAAAHGITQVGSMVTIQGVDSTFDGTYNIHSIPTGTSFTYVKVATNVSSSAVSPVGVATFIPVSSGFLVTNKVVQNYVATLTTGSVHGLAVGDWVSVTIGDSIYDTTLAQVIGIPTTTTFSYVVTTAAAASTVVSQGSFGKTSWSTTYTVPALTQGISSTLYVANMTNATQYYRIAAQKGGGTLRNQWIAYDTPIAANTTTAFTTGLSLNAAEIVVMQASDNRVIMTLDGSEIA